MPISFLKILKIRFICLALLLLPCLSNAQPNISIAQPFIDTQVCIGNTLKVNFVLTFGYFDTLNSVTIQLSDTDGHFTNAKNLATINLSSSYFISCPIPINTAPGAHYRIRAIASSPRDTSYDNGKNIRISQYPVITSSSNSPVCPGAGSTLNFFSSSVPAGANFSWTGPNGFVSVLQNAYKNNVQFTDSGKYVVTANYYSCKTTDTVPAIVITPPKTYIIPHGTVVACAGDNFGLTDSTNVAGVHYNWKGPSNFTSSGTGASAFVIYQVPSKYTGWFVLTATVNGGCFTKDSVWVNVQPKPDTPTISSNSPVCLEHAIQLFSNSTTAGASFIWRGPNGFTSLLQNPVINNATYADGGDYFAIAKHTNGCKSPESRLNIAIGTPVNPPTLSGNDMLCRGDSLLLSANSSNIGIYQWTGPNNFLALGKKVAIGNITTTEAGLYSVTLNHMGCTSVPATINVTVTDVPEPIASNNSPICNGSDLFLYAKDIPNATYSWTGPGGFISNMQNPLRLSATINATGSYSVKAQVLNCNNSSTTYAEINPIPAITKISSNTPVCIGSELNLHSDASLPGAYFAWRGPNGFNTQGQDPSLTIGASGAGIYYAKAIAKGCVSVEDSISVQTKELPAVPNITNNGPLNTGQELILHSDCATPGAVLNWTGPLGFTSSETDVSIKEVTDEYKGAYIVTATYDGCISTDSTSVIINPLKNSFFGLFPNPNNGNFSISGFTKTNSTVFLEITNMGGQIIYRNSGLPVHKRFSIGVNTENLTSGPYLLYLSSVGEKQVIRFIVNK
jgi:hypothetical protein